LSIYDNWDAKTEALPGTMLKGALKVDADLVSQSGDAVSKPFLAKNLVDIYWPTAKTTMGSPLPDVVVFEPWAGGLGVRLQELGCRNRVDKSGVDVMSLVAQRPTALVLCGPSPDPDHRRLVTAALRVRFPSIPVYYVSTHAGDPRAEDGAKQEGAVGIIKWPLPDDKWVKRFLAPHIKLVAPELLLSEDSIKRRRKKRALNKEESFDGPTVETTPESISSGNVLAFVDEYASPEIEKPKDRDAREIRARLEQTPPFLKPETNPGKSGKEKWHSTEEFPVANIRKKPEARGRAKGHRPATPHDMAETEQLPLPKAAPKKSRRATRREADSVFSQSASNIMRSLAPFLWGLEDAIDYLEEAAEEGDSQADAHAKTLRLLTKLLAQLDKRLENVGR
jgi:hypothetical protein